MASTTLLRPFVDPVDPEFDPALFFADRGRAHAAQRDEAIRGTALEWAMRTPEPQVGQLDLDNFPFQRQWYEEEITSAEVVVWMKSAQVGLSSYAWRFGARQADVFGDTVIYIFPTDVHVRDFGDQRIEPSIEACFPAGEMVLTWQGYRPIEAVERGDIVLTHRGRWRRVLDARCTGEREIVRLRGHGIPDVRCTPNHPFLTQKYGGEADWRPAVELKQTSVYEPMIPESPRTLTSVVTEIMNEPQVRRMRRELEKTAALRTRFDIPVDDLVTVLVMAALRKRRVLQAGHDDALAHGLINHPLTRGQLRWIERRTKRLFPTTRALIAERCAALRGEVPPPEHRGTAEDFWYFVGRYLADGCVVNAGDHLVIVVSCAKREEGELLGRLTRVLPHWRRREARAVSLSAGRDETAAWLRAGFGRYAHGKTLPGWALSLPLSQANALLTGYLDGDGHLTAGGVWHACTVSPALALGIAALARRTRGVVASVFPPYDDGGEYEIDGRRGRRRPSWQLQIRPSSRQDKIDAGGGWKPVRSVNAEGERERVYNLTVEEDETFVVANCAVHNSRYLSSRIKRQWVHHKTAKRIGAGWLLLRGSNSRAGAQSAAAQTLIFDERNLLDEGNLEQMMRRVRGARAIGKRPKLRFFGTPTVPSEGIDEQFQGSDQRKWLVTCDECDHEQEVTWEANVRWTMPGSRKRYRPGSDDPRIKAHEVDRHVIGRAWRVCAHCEEPIDVRKGRWVATQPESPVIGYHVTQLIVQGADMNALVVASRATKLTALEAFYNNDLGLPWSPSEASLDQATLLTACARGGELESGYMGGQPVTMGLDVASERDLNGRIDEQLPAEREGIPNPRKALWIGQIETFEDVALMLDTYRVQMLAIDAQPERRAAKELWSAFPGRVILVEFDDKNEADAIKVDWAELPGGARLPYKARVNRTEAIDAMMDSLRQGRNWPLRDPPDGWFEQMRAPKRRTVVTASGKAKRVYVSTGADDYAMADVYALVATEVWRMRVHLEAQEATQREQPLPDEQMGFRRLRLAGESDRYDPGFGGRF